MRPPSGVMCSAWGRCSLGKSIYCPSFHSLAMPPSEFPTCVCQHRHQDRPWFCDAGTRHRYAVGNGVSRTSLMVSSSRSNRSMLLLAGE